MPSRNLAYTIIYPIFKHYQTPHFHCQLVMPNPYVWSSNHLLINYSNSPTE
jgi:hypothetical protein